MSHTTSLALNRLPVKRHAAREYLIHDYFMAGGKKWETKSDLQRVFLKRVREELDAQGVSENELARRVGGPKQKTLNDVMNGRDPRLKTVEQIAKALGVMPPWRLFVEGETKTGRRFLRGGESTPEIPLRETGLKDKAKGSRKG